MNIHRVYEFLFKGFRVARMRRFRDTLQPGEDTTILDVGGTAYNWNAVEMRSQVTILNLGAPPDVSADPPSETRPRVSFGARRSAPGGCNKPNYTFVSGTGTDLRYSDGSFDVAFSNSVIEHLASAEDRRAFARELRRVGRCLWVQTPARSFPFEPHLLAPFIHLLPRHWQRRLVRNFTGWGLLTRPSAERVDAVLGEIHLLGFDAMQALFPDCEIQVERFLGLPKAYVAVRRDA